MTIKDLWDQFLNLNLIPIFEVLALTIIASLVTLAMILGGISWWLHKSKK